MPNSRSKTIRQFILEKIETNSNSIASMTAQQFGISRQAVGKHIRALVEDGTLELSGATRRRIYSIKSNDWEKIYSLASRLDEDMVWKNDIRPLLGELPKNVLNIWAYGITEMLNNAIDHSEGSNVIISVVSNPLYHTVFITDNGVGIFKKIQKALSLQEENHAVLELAKGKFTTDSKHHSGEGIFFTSRIVDWFVIQSGNIRFCHNERDFLLGRDYDNEEYKEGTGVILRVNNHSRRTLQEVFNFYTTENDGGFGFDKTIVPVRLALQGSEMLVSRSQSKRLLSRFDRFQCVMLDFEGIDEIGQAFADEVFRVFQNDNPETKIVYFNENDQIRKMIRRAEAATQRERQDSGER